MYEPVRDLLTAEAFAARVKAKSAEWGGLLDEDAAARLVLDELGRGTASFQTVRELREGMEVALRVRVDGIVTDLSNVAMVDSEIQRSPMLTTRFRAGGPPSSWGRWPSFPPGPTQS